MSTQEATFFLEQARNDLLSFCVFSDRFFEIIAIHEQMAEALEKVERWEIKKLILELPPRSGKSRIIREFLAKYLWKHPKTDVLLTGHSSSLLESFSRQIQERMNSDEYKLLFNTRIKEWNAWVKSWATTDWGEFAVYGVWGGITGRWGNLLIIDDPYATREDAESDTIRKKVSDWYWSTFLSRRQNENAVQIIIMQRWREDDLVGEILEKEKDWHRVTIPAINEKWESFWASKFSVEYLQKMRKTIGENFFMSQYQQDPISSDWGDFQKDFFVYEGEKENLENMNIVTFIDPAISQKQDADFTAIVTVGQDIQTNLYYLLEVKHLKALPNEIISELFWTVQKYGQINASYKVGIEVVQYQKMLALAIRDEMRKRNQFFMLEEMRPSGEKEARIRSILQPLYANHQIVHCNEVENTNELENELIKFPNGKHDDLIDAEASGISLLKSSPPWGWNDISVPEYV